MIRVLSIIGADNGWGLANRARHLANVLSPHCETHVVPIATLGEVSDEFDIVHAHSLVLIQHLVKHGWTSHPCWGFEVISERSLSHLRDVPAGIVSSARFCVVKNPLLGQHMLRHVHCPTTYIPNGTDLSTFGPRPFRVGWCGNKSPGGMRYKGVGLIREAVDLVNQDWRGLGRAEFVMDPGNYPDSVLPHPELAEWYRTLDVFVSASQAEGCSNVILEALACGVPVVATPVGIARELAHEVGLTLASRTARSIADGLKIVLNSFIARRSLMQKYAWLQIAPRYIQLYEGVLE